MAAAANPYVEVLDFVLTKYRTDLVGISDLYLKVVRADRLDNYLLLRQRLSLDPSFSPQRLLIEAFRSCALSMLRHLVQTEGIEWGSPDRFAFIHRCFDPSFTLRYRILLALLFELDFPFTNDYMGQVVSHGALSAQQLQEFLRRGWIPHERTILEVADRRKLQSDAELQIRLMLAWPDILPPPSLLEKVINGGYRLSFVEFLAAGRFQPSSASSSPILPFKWPRVTLRPTKFRSEAGRLRALHALGLVQVNAQDSLWAALGAAAAIETLEVLIDIYQSELPCKFDRDALRKLSSDASLRTYLELHVRRRVPLPSELYYSLAVAPLGYQITSLGRADLISYLWEQRIPLPNSDLADFWKIILMLPVGDVRIHETISALRRLHTLAPIPDLRHLFESIKVQFDSPLVQVRDHACHRVLFLVEIGLELSLDEEALTGVLPALGNLFD